MWCCSMLQLGYKFFVVGFVLCLCANRGDEFVRLIEKFVTVSDCCFFDMLRPLEKNVAPILPLCFASDFPLSSIFESWTLGLRCCLLFFPQLVWKTPVFFCCNHLFLFCFFATVLLLYCIGAHDGKSSIVRPSRSCAPFLTKGSGLLVSLRTSFNICYDFMLHICYDLIFHFYTAYSLTMWPDTYII